MNVFSKVKTSIKQLVSIKNGKLTKDVIPIDLCGALWGMRLAYWRAAAYEYSISIMVIDIEMSQSVGASKNI